MSKRLDVLTALQELCRSIAPQADVVGLTDDDEAPSRVPAGGRFVVRSGDPGDPQVDLSPLVYNWTHRIPVEIICRADDNRSAEQMLDIALTAFGAAIMANRQLDGLCEWLDVTAPPTEGISIEGAAQTRGADLIVTAHYSTTSPTG